MYWKRRKQRERDLERELRSHLELEAEERQDAYAARRALGNTTLIQEDVRAVWGWTLVEQLAQDLRHAARSMRHAPVFTAVALLSLALGIGANTAIFELLDAVRLRNLPVPNPQQLMRIQIRGGNPGMGISNDPYQLTYPLLDEVRGHQQAFSGLLAWNGGDTFRIGEGAGVHRVPGVLVNGDFFTTLALSPAAGRLFNREDDRIGCAAPGVVLGYGFWQSEFGGQSSAIGKRLIVDGHPFEVIGAAPAKFSGLEVGRDFDFALPICAQGILQSGTRSLRRTDVYWLAVLGRLKPGWTRTQASDHLQAISPGLLEATLPVGYSAKSVVGYRKLRLEAVPAANGISSLRGQYDTSLWLLLGITGLVLLIACSNLANLMVARSSARGREFAVRLALGASRIRLVRQALCESLVLAAAGGALGLAIARSLSAGITRFLGTEAAPLPLDLGFDWRVLAFSAGAAIGACVLFGLLPALRASRIDPGAAIKGGGRGLTADRERFSFQRFMVAAQVAFSLVLLVGALLFVRSFRNLVTLDPGFRERGILQANFDMSHAGLSPAAIKPFQRDFLEEIRSMPQVEAAATTTTFLIRNGMWSLGVRVGTTDGDSRFTWVSPGYFQLLETPLLAGRDFNAGDTETSPKVAIVNQTFARRYFGSVNPVGKVFRSRAEPNYPEAQYEIVAVVKDTRYFDLRWPTPPMSYAPASQYPSQGPWSNLYIRSSAPLAGVAAAIQRRLAESHPEITADFRVFQTQIDDSLIRERLMATLSGFFGVLAAILTTIGLYGVIAYMVVRRRNEIGIRMALGADQRKVLGMVLREAAVLFAIGGAAGVIGSLALTRAAGSLLFGLGPRDPVSFGAAVALLGAAAALGSYIPAWRASRLDPMTSLRCE